MTTILTFTYAVCHFTSSVRDRLKFLEAIKPFPIHQAEMQFTAIFLSHFTSKLDLNLRKKLVK